jgi:hypothetical protein
MTRPAEKPDTSFCPKPSTAQLTVVLVRVIVTAPAAAAFLTASADLSTGRLGACFQITSLTCQSGL